MEVNCFGSEVARLSVHASMHTPPIVDLWMERKNDYHLSRRHSSPLHELLSTHALKIRVLLVAVHLHALPIWLLTVFTHRNFPGFYPHNFLLQIRVLSIAVHSHTEGFLPVLVFTHRILLDLPMQQFSSADWWIVWLYPVLTDDCGFCIVAHALPQAGRL